MMKLMKKKMVRMVHETEFEERVTPLLGKSDTTSLGINIYIHISILFVAMNEQSVQHAHTPQKCHSTRLTPAQNPPSLSLFFCFQVGIDHQFTPPVRNPLLRNHPPPPRSRHPSSSSSSSLSSPRLALPELPRGHVRDGKVFVTAVARWVEGFVRFAACTVLD